MQMAAKAWADRYNAQRVPKPVDFIECWMCHVPQRANLAFAAEPYIEGSFTKYSSNSGFVTDEGEPSKLTPRRSSHTLSASLNARAMGQLYRPISTLLWLRCCCYTLALTTLRCCSHTPTPVRTVVRHTPHAFSHFTYEASGGTELVRHGRRTRGLVAA